MTLAASQPSTSYMLHTEEAEINALLDGWLAASVITQAEYDRVYKQPDGIACALIPQSVVLVGQTVTWQDVYQARNP